MFYSKRDVHFQRYKPSPFKGCLAEDSCIASNMLFFCFETIVEGQKQTSYDVLVT